MGMKKVKDMDQDEVINELRDAHFIGDSMEPRVLALASSCEFSSEIIKRGRLEALQGSLKKFLRLE